MREAKRGENRHTTTLSERARVAAVAKVVIEIHDHSSQPSTNTFVRGQVN